VHLLWLATAVLTSLISLSTLLVMLFVSRGFYLAWIYSKRLAKACAGSQHEVVAVRATDFSWRLLLESSSTLSLVALSFAFQSLWFLARAELLLEPGYLGLAVIGFSQASLANCSRFGAALCGMANNGMTGAEETEEVSGGDEWKTGNGAWDAKVLELASRGFTLRALLKFYGELGPKFDAAKHSTADVVRDAIIPMSCGTKYGNCAAAVVIMNGKTVVPERMVTHAWSNNFTHLVASVVANALRLPDYQDLVMRLSSPAELRALQAELYWKGLLDLSYWICAFSVNQHAGICRNLSNCPCGHQIFWSSTPPLHGKQSINCEMNKFVDMMSCLKCISPRFKQVIATDMSFNLFSRAWCVAEIHRGRQMRLSQSMAMHSEASLREHEAKLRGMKVQEMKASNPDDVELILSQISDLDAFNQEVQQLIFDTDGLVPTWCKGLEQMSLLGEVARRGYVLSRHSCNAPLCE